MYLEIAMVTVRNYQERAKSGRFAESKLVNGANFYRKARTHRVALENNIVLLQPQLRDLIFGIYLKIRWNSQPLPNCDGQIKLLNYVNKLILLTNFTSSYFLTLSESVFWLGKPSTDSGQFLGEISQPKPS